MLQFQQSLRLMLMNFVIDDWKIEDVMEKISHRWFKFAVKLVKIVKNGDGKEKA